MGKKNNGFPHENMIMSNSIVKSAVPRCSVKFAILKADTNINVVPNDLASTFGRTFGMQQEIFYQKGFDSFRMGLQFPECLDNVDIISDAENIKQLIKVADMPDTTISMLVHRVGKTLLLDEFGSNQNPTNEDWDLMNTFMSYKNNQSLCMEEAFLKLKDMSYAAADDDDLFEKFLHYSNVTSDGNYSRFNKNEYNAIKPEVIFETVLPEPAFEISIPMPKYGHAFRRNILWNLEGVQMLVGTNMHVYEGSEGTPVSLRLRDVATPFTSATAKDYWLDNLMLDVPEVVICYHSDGIIKRYEQIETVNMPIREHCEFSTSLVRNVTRNIFSCLKQNATINGHTYWLYKGENDKDLILYDLTVMSEHNEQLHHFPETPFTVPIAMLNYKLAKSLVFDQNELSNEKTAYIHEILINCVQMIPEKQYEPIMASIFYILSVLYIPNDFDFNALNDFENENDNVQLISKKTEIKAQKFVTFEKICESFNAKRFRGTADDRPPIYKTTNERYHKGLLQIVAGLQCLRYLSMDEERYVKKNEHCTKNELITMLIDNKVTQPHDQPTDSCLLTKTLSAFVSLFISDYPTPTPPTSAMTSASPSTTEFTFASPTADTSKSASTSASTSSSVLSSTPQSASNFNKNQKFSNPQVLILDPYATKIFKSWKTHLKMLFIQKAGVLYAIKSRHAFSESLYGASLKYAYTAIRCQQMTQYYSNFAFKDSFLFTWAADILHTIIVNFKNFDEYFREYNCLSDLDKNVLYELKISLGSLFNKHIEEPVKDLLQMVDKLFILYDIVLNSIAPEKIMSYYTRYGGEYNNLSKNLVVLAEDYYNANISACANPIQKLQIDNHFKALINKALECLSRGLELPRAFDDKKNLSILILNKGFIIKCKAKPHFRAESNEDFSLAIQHYEEVFRCFEEGKRILGSRGYDKSIWDFIDWSHFDALYTVAAFIQDCCPKNDLSLFHHHKTALNMLKTAVSFCNVGGNSPDDKYLLREGYIYKRIGTYLFEEIKTKIAGATTIKSLLRSCEIHFDRAFYIFDKLKAPIPFLKLQIERSELQQLLVNATKNEHMAIHYLRIALNLYLQSFTFLNYIANSGDQVVPSSELLELLRNFDKGLQTTLNNLFKITNLKKEGYGGCVPFYKRMYLLTLHSKDLNDPISYAHHLTEVLPMITKIYTTNLK